MIFNKLSSRPLNKPANATKALEIIKTIKNGSSFLWRVLQTNKNYKLQ